MSQERLEILKLLRDQKITAEEAERLLRALTEGEQKARDRGGESAARGFNLGNMGWRAFEGTIKEMGRSLRSEIENAMRDPWAEIASFGKLHSEIPVSDNRFALPPGATLALWQSQRGDIELRAGEGDRCVVEGTIGHAFEVRGPAQVVAVELAGKGAIVHVPATLPELKVLAAAGSIHAAGLPFPLNLKTMGGDIELSRQAHRFTAQTMGGRLRLRLTPGIGGACRAEALGGGIDVAVPAGVSGTINVVAFGGRLNVDPAVGAPSYRDALGAQRAVIDLAGEAAATAATGATPATPKLELNIKSVGGPVDLGRSTP